MTTTPPTTLVHSMNFIKIGTTLCCLLFTLPGYAEHAAKPEYHKQYRYLLSIDRHFSSKSSSELASSAFEGYRQLEESLVPEPTGVARRCLLFLIRGKVSGFIMTANHEIGGHGAQLRALGIKNIRYSVGLNGGYTAFSLPLQTPLQDQIMVILGGMHASNLLSEITQKRFVEDSVISPSLAHLYFSSKYNQIGYIFSYDHNYSQKEKGHDVAHYIHEINSLYQTEHLNGPRLKNYNYWGLLDPFLAYSIYSAVTNRQFTLPLISLKVPGVSEPVKFLPSGELLLTPYGPELGIRNIVRISDRDYQLTLLHGKNQPFNTYGISLRSDHCLNYQKLTLGGEVRLWSQPQLLTAGNFTQAPVKTGGMLMVNTLFPVNTTVKIQTSFGYKTAGFAMGESLKRGAIFKTGVTITL